MLNIILVQMAEFYSILKDVKKTTEFCQPTSAASAPDSLQQLVHLVVSPLVSEAPLTVHHEPLEGAAEEDAKPTFVVRTSADLAAATSTTRKAFQTALAKRFVRKRYGRDINSHSHLFDMASALTPALRGMRYLYALKESEAGKEGLFELPVATVKGMIWQKLNERVQTSIRKEREGLSLQEADDGTGAGDPAAKRQKQGGGRCGDISVPAVPGFLDDCDDDDEQNQDNIPGTMSVEEEADEIIKRWHNAKVVLL